MNTELLEKRSSELRLVIEGWLMENGILKPDEKDTLEIIISGKELLGKETAPTKILPVEKTPARDMLLLDRLLSMTLRTFVSTSAIDDKRKNRLSNAFIQCNWFFTLGQIVRIPEGALRQYRGFGPLSYALVKEALAALDLSFGMNVPISDQEKSVLYSVRTSTLGYSGSSFNLFRSLEKHLPTVGDIALASEDELYVAFRSVGSSSNPPYEQRSVIHYVLLALEHFQLEGGIRSVAKAKK